MPTSDARQSAGEGLIAYRAWEPLGFDAPARRGQTSVSTESASGIKLPTADDVERIHQEAHKAGYAAGYDEGTARARMEAARLNSLVENLEKSLAELDRDVAAEMVALVVEITRHILRQALALNPEIILAVVREALTRLPQHHAAIHVHPEDAALVRTYIGEQLDHAGQRLVEDGQITRGGCRIEAAGSQIDATLETRWRRVIESLGNADHWFA